MIKCPKHLVRPRMKIIQALTGKNMNVGVGDGLTSIDPILTSKFTIAQLNRIIIKMMF